MKFLALLPVLATIGCTTVPSEVPADPSYAADIQPIFNNNCISCHTSSMPEGSYSLTSYAGTVGDGTDTIPNVIPDNADSSRLYRRITGVQPPQMPLGGVSLDTMKIATIRNWIDRGAKNN